MFIELHLTGHGTGACLSWQNHVHSELTRDRATGDARVPGRSRHEPFRLTRLPDQLSPALAGLCASGQRLSEAHIKAESDHGTLRFHLEEVLVVSWLCSIEDDRPLETVDLSYGRITWAWVEQDTTTTTSTWQVWS